MWYETLNPAHSALRVAHAAAARVLAVPTTAPASPTASGAAPKTPSSGTGGSAGSSGPAHDTAHLWLGVLITVGVFVGVFLIRRYAAARSSGGENWFTALVTTLKFPWRQKPNPGPNPGNPAAANPNTAAPCVRGLLVGADNRLSTSKVTAYLWTAVLFYILVVLALVILFDTVTFTAAIHKISLLYLVLLGGPYAAGVLAKGIVGAAVDNGSAQKSTAPAPKLADVFSDDDGNTDLIDTQYILFNLLVAGIVLVEFLHAPRNGAPAIPDFLAILTGGSAATYVANKGTSGVTPPPSIDLVSPATARVGSWVRLLGSNLVAQGETVAPHVFFNGIPAAGSNPDINPDRIDACLPAQIGPSPAAAVTVTVRSESGATGTATGKLTVVSDSVTVIDVTQIGRRITLRGAGFYTPGDIDPDGTPRATAMPPTVTLLAQSADARTDPDKCVTDSSTSTDLQLTVELPTGTAAGRYALGLVRSGQSYPTGRIVTVEQAAAD